MLQKARAALISALLLAPLVGAAPAAPTAAATTAAAAATTTAATPSDPQATAATGRVLDWLSHLPGRAGNRVVSGLFAGYSGSAFSLAQTEDLKAQTGQYPGLIACDYGSNGSSTIDSSCNADLKNWSARGGLVSVGVHAPNPVQPGLQGLYTHLDGFQQLTDPATTVGAAWQQTLDRIATGLADLNGAGVPVLFRPFHEMNTSGAGAFWWSGQDRAAYVSAWQYTYRYLTQAKGLHNLLWVYSPLCGAGDRAAYYPGDAYTDVVGLDCYPTDPAAAQGYGELTALHKPFAFAEIGPPNDPATHVPAPAGYDYGRWADAIRTRFPATTYFLAWNDKWSPTVQLGAPALMNDRWTLNLGGIDPSATTDPAGPPRPPAPGAVLEGFENGPDGWGGWQTLNGPWTVDEWASQQSHSLKADVDLTRPETYLNKVARQDLSAYSTLSVDARTAPWGNQAAGTTAKLYLRTGANKTWYDSGSTVVGPDGAVLTMPLAGVTDLADVEEIGVRFAPAPGASGQSSVYIDNLTATTPASTLGDFETGPDGWGAWRIKNGPWPVTEWAAQGTHSLKADVQLESGEAFLLRHYATPADLTGNLTLTATARTAPWGNQAAGTKAKLYVKAGAGCDWYDSGTYPVDADGTRLSFNLAAVPDLTRVCEIGVDFVPADGATGQSSVYVDAVSMR
ncbi:glycosyl hydrolase [Kitasatospora sp. NPDC057936]|uniref:glycosyl hydrolase n=1 Tax=Kitasatospora sp. NPDC057936 TaxID=3346283 RepID=UPI0036D7C71C